MSKWSKTGQPCPDQTNCKSSDAYAEDVHGHGFCFSCGNFFRGDMAVKPEPEDIEQMFIPIRGINEATCEFYDIGTKVTFGMLEYSRFVYPSGAIKHRSHLYPKKNRNHMWFNPASGNPELFGMDKFAKGSKASITITQGEYDAASVYQMLKGVSACVSVKNGDQSVGRDFAANQEYINSFDRIVLCFDNDPSGQAQLAEAAKFFDFKKVFVVHMSRKDANAYINPEDGDPDPDTFVREWRAAKRYTPDSILSSFAEFEEALAEDPSELLTDFPFASWNESLHGLFASQVAIIKGPEGIGKQLPNTTPIPTPNGFVLLGDLKKGDIIFGRDGKETRITFITETQQGVPCYELEFADGTKQIAGGPHKWGVYNTDGKYLVKTTEEILQEGVTRGDGISLYSVPIASPVQYREKDLPIDPYQLGYWLGDGHSYSRGITIGKEDISEISALVPIVREAEDRAGNFNVWFDGITQSKLSDLNVLVNKHIPEIYLTASVDQRMELLRGLMDSDGSVSGTGCEFYSSNLRLKNDFHQLARGLGYKTRERSKIPILNGKECREAYTIWFLAHGSKEIFKLNRKQSLVTYCTTRRATHKTIRSITPVDSVPSRCLTVDNDDHLFLCGTHYTVTHNTEIFRAIEYHILKNQDFPIGIIHMEESNATTLRGIATYELKQPVNDDSVVIPNSEIMKAVRAAMKDDSSRVMLHSSKDVEDEDLFLDSLRYMLAVGKCRIIFLDHITWLATGNMEDDERKLLDKISQEIKKLALQHNAAIVMISHINDNGQTRGSRNITKVADIVINLYRDKEAVTPEERNTLHFSAEKSRKQGTTTGPLGRARYDRYTGLLEEDVPKGTPDEYV